jgi:glycosyltransferase involved in cell wall biosynthesis
LFTPSQKPVLRYGLCLSEGAHSKIIRYAGNLEKVLDVGCASGYLRNELARRGCRVVGKDDPPDRIESSLVSAVGYPQGAHPGVSVIVPTCDRPEMLRRALTSIMNQTYRNFEVIVADTGVVDVQDMIPSLNDKGNIVYLRLSARQRLAVVRNAAIRVARGRYLAYLDDDDIFYPDHLQTLVTFLNSSDYSVAYTDANRAWQKKEGGAYVIKRKEVASSNDFDGDLILVRNLFPVLCIMHEKACLDQVGLFDESLSTHEDWELWIRMSRRFRFAHIRKITCELSWRTDGTTMTSRNRGDFLRSYKVICGRYAALAKDHSRVLRGQLSTIARLEAELKRPKCLYRIWLVLAVIRSRLRFVQATIVLSNE